MNRPGRRSLAVSACGGRPETQRQRPTAGRPEQVCEMFGRLSRRYDLMNRLITLGRDGSWRRRVVALAAPPAGGRLLDVGTGTGAIARLAARQHPRLEVVGCDFSPRMLRVAAESPFGDAVRWRLADALELPFPDESFDCVTSGYLLRNVTDVGRALREQARVLRPGGRLVCLETAPPPKGLLRPLLCLYLRQALPRVGRLVVGDAPAYRYLAETTAQFAEPEALAARVRGAGLEVTSVERRMFGTQTIVAARK